MTRAQLGSIQRLEKNRYRISIEGERDENGKRTRKTKVVRGSRNDAEIELAKMKLDANKPVETDMTLGAFWATMYEPTLTRLSPSTRRGYINTWDVHVKKLFGSELMAELTTREIERRLWTIEKAGAMENAFKLLRQMYNAAYNWELLEHNPFLRRIKLKQKAHYEPSVYTLEELREWTSIIRGTDIEAVCLVSAFGGGRREESTALYWDDIRFSLALGQDGSQELLAHISITKVLIEVDGRAVERLSTKTSGSTRTLIIAEPVSSRLKKLAKGGHAPLAADDEGISSDDRKGRMAPGRVADRLKIVMRSAKFKHVPMKNLRTTYATIQQQLGTDSSIISAMLGHSTFATAYAHYFVTNEASYIESARRLGRAV